MALSSTKVVKFIVVTDDLERTASAYRRLLGVDREPEPGNIPHRAIREPYTKYMGREITDTPMKVESVCSENVWFEIIQPLGSGDPWAAWLREHGTSICSVCLMTDGPIEADESVLREAGYDSIFKQEKGYEAYEYFDTSKDLGTLLEIKERY
ncbi:MAG: hypothetical protein ACSW8J_00185 [bacterium]